MDESQAQPMTTAKSQELVAYKHLDKKEQLRFYDKLKLAFIGAIVVIIVLFLYNLSKLLNFLIKIYIKFYLSIN